MVSDVRMQSQVVPSPTSMPWRGIPLVGMGEKEIGYRPVTVGTVSDAPKDVRFAPDPLYPDKRL